MSFKISSIVVDSFRAYKETEVFNFINSQNEVANLVVLYAPNGYGKTSLFDAIEWSLTGEISRISKNPNLLHAIKNQQGFILKNIDSDKKNGSVKIIASNSEIIEITTRKYGRAKDDYNAGNVITMGANFKKIRDQKKLTSTNLLTHDKIDNFLRTTSPSERYEQLKSFWDDNGDSITYGRLLDFFQEFIKRQDQLISLIHDKNKQLQQLSSIIERINQINVLVKKYNASSTSALSEVNIKSNSEELLEFSRELKSSLSNHERLLNDLKSSKANLILLHSGNSDFLENISSLEVTKKKLNENIDLLHIYEEKNIKDAELSQINNNLLQIYNEALKLTESIKHLDSISELNRVIDQLNDDLNISNNNIKKYYEDIMAFDYSINEYTFKINEKSKKIHDNYEKIANITSFMKEREQLKLRINQYQKKNNRLESVSREVTKNIEQITGEISYYKDYVTYITENDIKDLNNIYNEQSYKEALKFYNLLSQHTETLRIQQLNLIKQNDFSLDLLKNGIELIEINQTSNCPLCNKQYDSKEELMDQINNNLHISEKLREITLLLSEKQIELVKANEIVNSELKMLRNAVEDLVTFKEARVNFLRSKIESFKSRLRTNRNEILIISQRIMVIDAYVSQYFLNLDKDKIDFEPVIRNIKESIDLLNKENNDLTSLLGDLNLRKKEVTGLLIQAKGNIEIIETKISQAKSSETYQTAVALFDNYGTISIVELNAKVVALTNTFNEMKKVKENLIERIDYLTKELVEVEPSEIQTFIAVTKMDIQTIENKIDQYKDFYRENIKNLNEVDISFIEAEINVINTHVKEQEELLSIVKEAEDQLMYIQNNDLRIQIESEIMELSTTLSKYQKESQKVSFAKRISDEYIIRKINYAFNVESINQIYKRIDPHPQYNLVRFSPDLSKANPELNIYTTGINNSELAPILYFSSAQVNILSLSIFLAKALQEESVLLDTIFMDDPIQHLDSINILSFIDLLRTITTDLNKQVVISTHNDLFFELLKKKIDPSFFKAKYMELDSYGRVRSSQL